MDEPYPVTITAVSGNFVTLSQVLNTVTGVQVNVGDVLTQPGNVYGLVTSVNLATNQIGIEPGIVYTVAAATILPAFTCSLAWKQVVADNPAYTKQFSEGLAVFKSANFSNGLLDFATDFYTDTSQVAIEGNSEFTGQGRWGLFPWGQSLWGGEPLINPFNVRFLIPQNTQFGSYILPELTIQEGYANWKIQGLSINFENASDEVGR